MSKRFVQLSVPELSALMRLWHQGAPAELIAEKIGVGLVVVRRVARELALPPRVAPDWSPAEDRILRRHAPTMRAVDLVPLLPGRSLSAIKRRAYRLGITIHKVRSAFTPEEDQVGRAHFGREPVRTWAHRLPGRTAEQIIARARNLGLKSRLWARSRCRRRLEGEQPSERSRKSLSGSRQARRPCSFEGVVPVHARPPP